MKDLLIGILITIILFIIGSIFGGEVQEEPKRKQGSVQVPTLVEINPEEGTDIKIGENPENEILSPKTGGFWIENF